MLYYMKDNNSSKGLAVTDGMRAMVGDVVLEQCAFVTGGPNAQYVVQTIELLTECCSAGNLKVIKHQSPSSSGPASINNFLSFDEVIAAIGDYDPESLCKFVAEAKTALKSKTATNLQETALVQLVEVKEFQRLQHDVSAMVYKVKDGAVYPDGFLSDHQDLVGFEMNVFGQIVQVSLHDAIRGVLSVSKVFFFVGQQGGGKTKLCEALARMFSVRQRKTKFFYAKALDPLGMLTRMALTHQMGAFVIDDFSLVSQLQNVPLESAEVKALFGLTETATFAARYHSAQLPKGIQRLFAVNSGPGEEVSGAPTMDNGYWFDRQRFPVLGHLARGDQAALDRASDEEKAFARRMVIFPIHDRATIGIDELNVISMQEVELANQLAAELEWRLG